jgi:hypothetical protein
MGYQSEVFVFGPPAGWSADVTSEMLVSVFTDVWLLSRTFLETTLITSAHDNDTCTKLIFISDP